MKVIVYTSITGDKDADRTDVEIHGYVGMVTHHMNSRFAKCCPHLLMDCDWSIYVDGNLFLKKDPEVFVDMVGPFLTGVFTHPWRGTIEEEAEEVIRLGLDEPDIVTAQMARYEKTEAHSPLLHLKLAMCGLIVRKHCHAVNRMNERWWAELCAGSCRDQISFPVAYDFGVHYWDKPTDMSVNRYFYRKHHLVKRKSHAE